MSQKFVLNRESNSWEMRILILGMKQEHIYFEVKMKLHLKLLPDFFKLSDNSIRKWWLRSLSLFLCLTSF